jgi:hypothetical protein
MAYPEPTSQEVYFTSQAGDIINGWALENTPHNQALRRYLGAATWSPDYLHHLFGTWNVSTAVLRADEDAMESVAVTLSGIGFEIRQDLGEYQIWDAETAGSPLQVIPAERALVVGNGLPPLLLTYPFAQQADQPYLSQLEDDVLDNHPMIILSQFEANPSELKETEGRLSRYIQSGGTVVMDLSGMETNLGRTTDLFDVDVLRLRVAGEVQIRWQDEVAGDLPSVLSFSSVASDGWSGAVYENLDVVLAEIQYLGEWYPVLGYRDLGQGKAWFVGMNLLYYAQVSGASNIADVIRQITLEGVDVSQDHVFAAVPVDNWVVDDRGLAFDYTTDADLPEALLAYTYSPRWQVSIDGEPVEHTAYENLIQLSLPAGHHHVEIVYQAYGTAWPILGLGVGLLGVSVLAVLFTLEKSRMKTTAVVERVEEGIVEGVEYAPCANCGFRLAETRPPTAITYPFQVVHCPICGNGMTDEGYQPGSKLTPEQRRIALADWLKDQEYLPILEDSPLVNIPEDFFEKNSSRTPSKEEGEPTETVGSRDLL